MIYLDNAATTKTDKEVLNKMMPYLTYSYANPSAAYEEARWNSAAITKARMQIASLIGAKPEEIYFTSGGTEADNWALIGTFDRLCNKGNHIITSKIEHPAILNTCRYLEQYRGAEVTYLDVDEYGIVNPADVKEAITEETILISIMAANNEIGTVEPIAHIGEIAKEHHILFHTDAVQAFGHIPINVENDNIDMLSVSGHKIHAPKGVGFLYIREGTMIVPLIHGGSQENFMRAGTENVPGIVGLGAASAIARDTMNERLEREFKTRNHMLLKLIDEIPDIKINGHLSYRLSNNISITIEGVDAGTALVMLEAEGVEASAGSACSSGSIEPSHVLTAIGLTREQANSTIRMTISDDTTIEETDKAVDALRKVVEKVREM